MTMDTLALVNVVADTNNLFQDGMQLKRTHSN